MHHDQRSADIDVDHHPSQKDLAAYSRGQCDDDREQEIEQHILQCEVCCQTLLNLPDDLLLRRLASRHEAGDTDPLIGSISPDTDAGSFTVHQGIETAEFENLLHDHPKYKLVRRLGEGGMGVVYQAQHRIMDRMVALKVISPRMLRHPDAKSRFQREVQISAKLNHPNIVPAFDADQIGENLCLVSEYFEGESLDHIIDRGPVDVARACDIIIQAAQGLSHAHQNGLIHRDVKPQNILVSDSGQVKVVDFGLASYSEPDHPEHKGLTSEGVIVGTPDYLSPEQIRESAVDHRADIYSLGCTLYHLLAGSAPFSGCSRVEKLAHHLQSTPKRLGTERNDIPSELETCVAKMMAKNPDDRFQSADEVVAMLRACKSSDSGVLPPSIVTHDRPSVATKRKRARAPIPSRYLFAGVAALLLGILRVSVVPYLVKSTDGASAETLAALQQRRWEILAIIPPNPLPRDRNLIYNAIDDLGLNCQLTSASTTTSVEHVHKVIPLSEADPQQYDAVVFFGPSQNIATELNQPESKAQIDRILKKVRDNNQPYGSLGTGVWTLGQLGELRGKRIADCKHSTDSFKRETGAEWVSDETVVTDGNFVSGTNTRDAAPFLIALLQNAL
ncbi:MAG: protein kinase [Planctomycetales bacterium]|nr:protein kinase [Planctomycetales bacterium]